MNKRIMCFGDDKLIQDVLNGLYQGVKPTLNKPVEKSVLDKLFDRNPHEMTDQEAIEFFKELSDEEVNAIKSFIKEMLTTFSENEELTSILNVLTHKDVKPFKKEDMLGIYDTLDKGLDEIRGVTKNTQPITFASQDEIREVTNKPQPITFASAEELNQYINKVMRENSCVPGRCCKHPEMNFNEEYRNLIGRLGEDISVKYESLCDEVIKSIHALIDLIVKYNFTNIFFYNFNNEFARHNFVMNFDPKTLDMTFRSEDEDVVYEFRLNELSPDELMSVYNRILGSLDVIRWANTGLASI